MPVGTVLDTLERALIGTNPVIFLILLFLICWQFSGVRSAIFATLAMTVMGFLGLWMESMTTIALVLSSVLFTLAIGLPLGIIAGKSDRFELGITPILDVMQTLPGFVYMVPVVMLVGIGNVPGMIVSVVFAMPPIIRLTILGLREVSSQTLEAARAFGATESRILFRIQMPLATNTIMAGVNQTIMMALSMVVYASMIAVEGLGQMVLRGIGRLDVGLAAIGRHRNRHPGHDTGSHHPRHRRADMRSDVMDRTRPRRLHPIILSASPLNQRGTSMINIRKTGFRVHRSMLLAAFGASLGQAQDRGVGAGCRRWTARGIVSNRDREYRTRKAWLQG